MWLPQGGALKIENLQFTQYSIIFNIMLSVTAYNYCNGVWYRITANENLVLWQLLMLSSFVCCLLNKTQEERNDET